MSAKKRSKRSGGPSAPTLPELLEAVQVTGKVVADDINRMLGIVKNATSDLDDEKNRNRLTATAGRMRFTIGACTRYVSALSLLKQHLATQW